MARQTSYHRDEEYSLWRDPMVQFGLAMGKFKAVSWAAGIEGRAVSRAKMALGQSTRAITPKLAKGLPSPIQARQTLEAYGKAKGLMAKHGFLGQGAWDIAGKAGVKKQFAAIAASKVGAGAFAAIKVGIWAPAIYAGVHGAVTGIRSLGRSIPRIHFGDVFHDTEGTYTERQRSIQAITSSRMSVRSAIGGEAALLHR